MKSLTLASLLVCVTSSSLIAQTETPLARSIAREAARAASTASAPGVGEDPRPQSAAAQSWDGVRRLEPGTRLSVTVAGSAPVTRWFVAANDSELLVNDGAGMPQQVARSDVAQITIIAKKDLDFINRAMRPFMLIGLGAGFALGVGYCATHSCDTTAWVLGTSAYTSVGLLMGGTAGVVVALTRDNSRVIYRAP